MAVIETIATIFLFFGAFNFVWWFACIIMSRLTQDDKKREGYKNATMIFGNLFFLSLIILTLVSLIGISIGSVNNDVRSPDGWLYLKWGNLSQDIYIGHEEIIELCRSEEPTWYIDYYDRQMPLDCKELFMGCGAVNCECWVVD